MENNRYCRKKIHGIFGVKKSRFIILLLFLSTLFSVQANTDKNVRASILIADPDDILYSCTGHACIRMQSKALNLDYVFSYESEDVKSQIQTFLQGDLKMGLISAPTDEYLETLRQVGRGVREYELNLPNKVKTHLWEVLDNHVAAGMNLEYNYLERGCAYSIIGFLREALGDIPLKYGTMPRHFHMTRRELVDRVVRDYPWDRFFLYLLVGTKADLPCTMEEKIVVPQDLVDVLVNATVQGKTVLNKDYQTLIESTPKVKRLNTIATPLLFSILVLVLTFMGIWEDQWVLFIPLLLIQTVLGTGLLYLLSVSTLPCTTWNWLIIPLNPIPLILWKRRRLWGRPYAALLMLWVVAISVYPHRLTDTPYIILAVALSLLYFSVGKKKTYTDFKNR